MGRKSLDLLGRRYGRLVVIAQAPTLRYSRWRCVCDCGAVVIVSAQLLGMGAAGTRSCGCLRVEQRRAALLRMWETRRPPRKQQNSSIELAHTWRML